MVALNPPSVSLGILTQLRLQVPCEGVPSSKAGQLLIRPSLELLRRANERSNVA
jgi:hypothetical protein